MNPSKVRRFFRVQIDPKPQATPKLPEKNSVADHGRSSSEGFRFRVGFWSLRLFFNYDDAPFLQNAPAQTEPTE